MWLVGRQENKAKLRHIVMAPPQGELSPQVTERANFHPLRHFVPPLPKGEANNVAKLIHVIGRAGACSRRTKTMLLHF